MHPSRCTHLYIQPQVDLYEKLVEFVGMKESEYLLILDVKNRLKYTLALDNADLRSKFCVIERIVG